MPPRLSSWRITIAAALAILWPLLVVASSALAQQSGDAPSAAAEISTPRAYVGDVVRLRVRVDNAQSLEPPDLSGFVPGLSIAYDGTSNASSVRTMIINGRMSREETRRLYMEYSVRADRPGLYTIPSIEFVADGTRLRTQPVSVQIAEPIAASAHTLTLELGKADAFEGEWVPLTLVWTVGADVRTPVRLTTPPLDPGVEVRPLFQQPADETGRIALQRDLNRFEVDVFGTRAIALQTRTDAARLTIPLLVRASKPGRYSLGPVTIDFREVTGRRQRTFFDAPWDDPAITERRVLKSDDARLIVEALPREGRPPGFSGLVGSYALRASASPTSARVGEPIAFRVEVSAPAPLDALPPLNLSSRDDVTSRFRVPREPILGDPRPDSSGSPRGVVGFSAPIRARSSDVTEIPPISLNYFDPATRKYSIASTNPVPLTITGSSVALDDIDEETLAGPARRDPTETLRSFMPWTPTESRPPAAPAAGLGTRATAAMLAAPPLLVGALGLVRLGQSRAARNPAAARRRRALRRALRTLRGPRLHRTAATIAADPCGTATRATCGYIADMLNAPDAGFTPEQAIALLRKKLPSAADLATPPLQRWTSARFSRQSDPQIDPLAEAGELIHALRIELEERQAP